MYNSFYSITKIYNTSKNDPENKNFWDGIDKFTNFQVYQTIPLMRHMLKHQTIKTIKIELRKIVDIQKKSYNMTKIRTVPKIWTKYQMQQNI